AAAPPTPRAIPTATSQSSLPLVSCCLLLSTAPPGVTHRNTQRRAALVWLKPARSSGHVWSSKENRMMRFIALLTLLAVALPLGGCVVVAPRPGYCYWHPY